MATGGKHARDSRLQRRGQHGVEVRPRISAFRVFAIAALVVAVGLIPLSLSRSHIGLDSQAFADQTRSAFPELSDSQVDEHLDVALSEAVGDVVPSAEADFTSHVSALLQNGVLPGGCEIVSLAIALNSMGLPVDLDAIVNDHLPLDGHFATGYSGDPHSKGAGYPAGIVRAADSYLSSLGAAQRAHDLTGASFSTLRAFVEAGYPVLVWTTMGLTEPSFEAAWDAGMEWYSNEHCVVMYEAHDEYVLVSDPLEGLVQRDAGRFAKIFEECGSMALVVY